SADPQFLLIHNAVNRACSDIARHQVSVLRIPLFQKIKSLCFGNALGRALLRRISRDPNASAFSTRRFAHQAQLVFAGNRRRMHLDELGVRLVDAPPEPWGMPPPRPPPPIRRAPKNRANST